MKRTEEQYNEYITINIEKTTGRADFTLKTNDGNVYYYAEKHGNKWELKFCENGYCYNATLIETCKTLKECNVIIHDICDTLTEHYMSVEDSLAYYRKYKGYTITGNANTGFVTLDPYGYYSGKVYKSEDEAIADIEKDIADSVPIEETDSFEVPVEDEEPAEVIDRAHEILSNAELDVRNRYYGKQVIDAKMNIIKTELTGFHVSGIITETGTMALTCDIYSQDLEIEESYLAYNDVSGYSVYDKIRLTRIEIFPSAEAVKQFFVSRVEALETETIKRLY